MEVKLIDHDELPTNLKGIELIDNSGNELGEVIIGVTDPSCAVTLARYMRHFNFTLEDFNVVLDTIEGKRTGNLK